MLMALSQKNGRMVHQFHLSRSHSKLPKQGGFEIINTIILYTEGDYEKSSEIKG